jgi:hypothetical protein
MKKLTRRRKRSRFIPRLKELGPVLTFLTALVTAIAGPIRALHGGG